MTYFDRLYAGSSRIYWCYRNDNDSIPMREIGLNEDYTVVDLRYSKKQIELFLYSSIAQLVVALDC